MGATGAGTYVVACICCVMLCCYCFWPMQTRDNCFQSTCDDPFDAIEFDVHMFVR